MVVVKGRKACILYGKSESLTLHWPSIRFLLKYDVANSQVRISCR